MAGGTSAGTNAGTGNGTSLNNGSNVSNGMGKDPHGAIDQASLINSSIDNKKQNSIDKFQAHKNELGNGNKNRGKVGNWSNDNNSSFMNKSSSSTDRDTRNNTNNVKAAAEVASKSANPYAKAIGEGIKVADKITGGKASETIGKGITKVNQSSPMGRKVQKASNMVSESGFSNKISKASSGKNGVSDTNKNADDKMMQGIRDKQRVNQQNSNIGRKNSLFSMGEDSDSSEEQDSSSSLDEEENESFNAFNGKGKVLATSIVKIAVATVIPLLLIVFPVVIVVSSVSNIFSSFLDNFKIDDLTGYDLAELEYTGNDDEQQFILRVNVIYETYLQSTGSYFDPHLVVSTFFILRENGATISYNDMTDSAIREIVRAMFKGLVYDKDTFRNNLILSIIPKYLPDTTTREREAIADAIFKHTEDYHKIRQDKANGGVNGTQSTGEFSKWKQYEGEWASLPMGNSGQTVKQIGCFVTSIAILIAKSGVPTTINPFNPGTFVEFLNKNGGFDSEGNFIDLNNATKVAPTFKPDGREDNLLGMSREEKFNKIKQILTTPNTYAMVEVKGNTGQHWVALDTIQGDNILMMDPGSKATNLWEEYNWQNTSTIITFKVG